jgi:hypothetical protein
MLNQLKNKIAEWKLDLIKRWILEVDKHEVLTMAIKKLYHAVGEEDILKEKSFCCKANIYKGFCVECANPVNKKVLSYNNEILNEGEITLIQAEASNFKNTKLWQILQKELEWQAIKRIGLDSRTTDDLIAGKSQLFNLEVIKSVLNRISKFTQT